MKKILLAVSTLLIISGCIAQQKVYNDPNAEVRIVKNFHAIRVSGGIHLYLTQGNEEALAVSASDPEYRARIKTEVTDGVLRIYSDRSAWDFWHDMDRMKLRAYVSFKMLDELRASSGSHVEVNGPVKSENLVLHFSSGANFRGSVQVSKLKVEQNSGAESEVSGSAVSCSIGASSGSSFNGFDLQTDICDASTSSGATLRVTVNKELSASASSGGEIHYKGTGLIKEISTGSGGAVTRN